MNDGLERTRQKNPILQRGLEMLKKQLIASKMPRLDTVAIIRIWQPEK